MPGRAAHTHRVNLRTVERFAASSSCSFSPRPSRLAPSFAFARARRVARSHGGESPRVFFFPPHALAHPLPGINVINCRGSRYRISIRAARPTTITLPGEPRRRARCASRPEKHAAARKGHALPTLSPRRFFSAATFGGSVLSARPRGSRRGLIVNLPD